jgi:hypothetical protein
MHRERDWPRVCVLIARQPSTSRFMRPSVSLGWTGSFLTGKLSFDLISFSSEFQAGGLSPPATRFFDDYYFKQMPGRIVLKSHLLDNLEAFFYLKLVSVVKLSAF